jgi:hypothetical protein
VPAGLDAPREELLPILATAYSERNAQRGAMSIRRVLFAFLGLVSIAALYVGGAWFGCYGRHEDAGEPTATPIPAKVVRT